MEQLALDTLRPTPPWQKPRGIDAVLQAWDRSLKPCLVLEHRLASRGASTEAFPSWLATAIRRALQKRQITELYLHQRKALDLAAAGRDFVVATPTASGKSLCFHLPVLQAVSEDAESRALYLFPTKALARDQEQSLQQLVRDAELGAAVCTYDGDTPGDARRSARAKGSMILTNPDMLHSGILPHHTAWSQFFAGLKYVVIDEMHTYRGVFGSHLANVLRRLQRIAAFYGSEPRFLFASATIANPSAHAGALAGRTVELVEENGAPSGPRHVLVYNPPLVNAELGIRSSYLKSAVRLAGDLVRAEVTTLIFGLSRNGVETMLKYLRDSLRDEPALVDRIVAYRGGYLPDERRRIEAGLRNGEIVCVAATSALELGIDIGAVEAVICAGYPGSLAGLWQRFGRGGRRSGPSLGLLVASSAPLDQYLAQQSEDFLVRPVEHARVDPDNLEILIQHLKCSAFELPWEPQEAAFGVLRGADLEQALQYLSEHGWLHRKESNGKLTYSWVNQAYPANDVSLRNAGWKNVVIVDLDTHRAVGELDWRSAHSMLHEKAIYQHSGSQYQVERFDYDNHKAYVRRVAPDYYTEAMTHSEVRVLVEESKGSISLRTLQLDALLGELDVEERVVGYKKIRFHTHENLGYGEVELPSMKMQTTGFWVIIPWRVLHPDVISPPLVMEAMKSFAHALHIVAVMKLMTDPHDLGYTVSQRIRAESINAVYQRSQAEGTTPGISASAPNPHDSKSSALNSSVRNRSAISSNASNHSAPDLGVPNRTDLNLSDSDRVEPKPNRSEFTDELTRRDKVCHTDESNRTDMRDGESEGERQKDDPTIFLYDHIAGGVGLASQLFVERDHLLREAVKLVRRCSCSIGCPACVGPRVAPRSRFSEHGGDTEPNIKHILRRLLDELGL